jgi:hypothetical protein
MVVAAGKAYSDLIKWMKSARPRRLDAWWFARHDFTGALVAGLVVLGLIGLLSPSTFGPYQSGVWGSGWPSYLLAGLVALTALYPASRLTRVKRTVVRVTEPWFRPLEENPAFEGALNALAACPGPLRTRFALGWVWAPAVLVVLGSTFAFATAYFLVDAVLARFLVGWGQPLYAAVFALSSIVTFRLAAPRTSTWRLATSVYREVSEGGFEA